MIRKITNTRGVVFIAALAVTAILFGLGTVYMQMTRSETGVVARERYSMQALYFAEAGIEYAMSELKANVDIDGDGTIGSIQPMDLDMNGTADVNVAYNLTTGSMQSTGTKGFTTQTVEADIDTSGFPAAVLAGNLIYFANTTGSINGDVVGGNITSGSFPNVNVVGTVTNRATNISSEIPRPLFPTYYSVADYIYATDKTYNDTDNVPPPPINNGIHYISGNLTITGSNVVIDGTLVVFGTLTIAMNANGNLTINPFLPGYPAVIVGNDLQSTSSNATLILNGLVYVDRWMYIGSLATMVVNGALVLRSSTGSGMEVGTMGAGNLTVNYDPDMQGQHFYLQGGGAPPPVMVSWKGHKG